MASMAVQQPSQELRSRVHAHIGPALTMRLQGAKSSFVQRLNRQRGTSSELPMVHNAVVLWRMPLAESQHTLAETRGAEQMSNLDGSARSLSSC
jgi:hypothetical protein